MTTRAILEWIPGMKTEEAIAFLDRERPSRPQLTPEYGTDWHEVSILIADELKRVYPEISEASDLKYVIRRAITKGHPQPAPGLREALRAAVWCIDNHYEEGCGPCDCNSAKVARAALAQSERGGE